MQIATVASALLPLALLACPIGMGAMMWMMGRSKKGQDQAESTGPPASVEVLREQQRRVSAQIEQLEAAGAGGDRVAKRS